MTSRFLAPSPVMFDFERDTDPPDWLCDGILERGTVVVLSGDTAAGKSLVADALTAAVLRGTRWLGLDVQPGRVLYIDEENHRRLVRDRLKAFGVTNGLRAGLRYYLRAGVSLGEQAWNEWLAAETQDHRADLVVIDTASSATAIDGNDNASVAQLYRDALRPATVNGATVLLLHHERKTSGDYARNASQAMLGARQWAGQADGHVAIRATGSLTGESDDDGRLRQRFPVELEVAKTRDGTPAIPGSFEILSVRGTDGRLERMELRGTGPSTPRESSDERMARNIADVLAEKGQSKLAEIAAGLGVGSNDGRLGRALKRLQSEGRVTRAGHGVYRLTEP